MGRHLHGVHAVVLALLLFGGGTRAEPVTRPQASPSDGSGEPREAREVSVVLPLPEVAMSLPGWLDVRFGGQPPADVAATCKRQQMDDGETPRICHACRAGANPMFDCMTVEVADAGGILGIGATLLNSVSRATATATLSQAWGAAGKLRENGNPCWQVQAFQGFVTDEDMIVVTPVSPFKCIAPHATRVVNGPAAARSCRLYDEAWEHLCGRCNGDVNACAGVRSPNCASVTGAPADDVLQSTCVPALQTMTCADYSSGYLPPACWGFEDALQAQGASTSASKVKSQVPLGWSDLAPDHATMVRLASTWRCKAEPGSHPTFKTCTVCRSQSLAFPCVRVGFADDNVLGFTFEMSQAFTLEVAMAQLVSAWGKPTSTTSTMTMTTCWDHGRGPLSHAALGLRSTASGSGYVLAMTTSSACRAAR